MSENKIVKAPAVRKFKQYRMGFKDAMTNYKRAGMESDQDYQTGYRIGRELLSKEMAEVMNTYAITDDDLKRYG